MEQPPTRRLEDECAAKISGTLSMMSNGRIEYIRKLSFVLDTFYLVPLMHVSRSQMILLLRGGHIGDPETFLGQVLE